MGLPKSIENTCGKNAMMAVDEYLKAESSRRPYYQEALWAVAWVSRHKETAGASSDPLNYSSISLFHPRRQNP